MVPWRLLACVATLACAPPVAATDAAARTACPVQALDQAHASIGRLPGLAGGRLPLLVECDEPGPERRQRRMAWGSPEAASAATRERHGPELKFAVFILRPANAEASPKRGPTR